MKKSLTNSQLAILIATLLIITSSITIRAAQVIIQGVYQFGASAFSGNITQISGQYLAPDGTSGAPSYSFTSAPTLGFWKSAVTTITLQGTLKASGDVNGQNIQAADTQEIYWTNRTAFLSPVNGVLNILTSNNGIGSQIKVDALPTVASGFGSTPAVVTGSTPFAGSVNVGTGGSATSGIINFNGTAFPSAPHCACNDTTTTLAQRCTGSITQLTITSAAWTASDIVDWICVSSK